MPRVARLVIPGLPHHVTQRGVRRQRTFFSDDDYRLYLDLLADRCARHGVEVWAYCLMPNHVHLLAVPEEAGSLAAALGRTHQAYTTRLNAREGCSGYLWQGRFASFVLDGEHLSRAARYVELNPVRARLVVAATDWRWSSARAHCGLGDDPVVKVEALLELVPGWAEMLALASLAEEELAELRRHEGHGMPLGGEEFVAGLEARAGRRLQRAAVGRPRAG